MNTREQIIVSGLMLLCEQGLLGVTRNAVAEKAGVSPALVSHYMGTITQFRDLLVQVAIDREVSGAVAHALAAMHPVALAAPQEVKTKAIRHLNETTL